MPLNYNFQLMNTTDRGWQIGNRCVMANYITFFNKRMKLNDFVVSARYGVW